MSRSLDRRTCLVLACASVWCAQRIDSQSPTRDNYYFYVPSAGPIVSQRDASAELSLYGNVASVTYRDANGDGIDDVRARRLSDIAERFSPILRRNNFSVPREFESLLAPDVLLNADTWVDGHRIASDSVFLGTKVPAQHDGPIGSDRLHVTREADRALTALLREFDPARAPRSVVSPEGSSEKILFFDFPGSTERSWRKAYGSSHSGAHAYVHFFIKRAAQDPSPVPLFDLIAQYWFFYPFNDSANNHEGDWEHINVWISTLDRTDVLADPIRFGRSLRADEVERILQTPGTPLDSLSVRAVDYYFHHAVMTLDYVQILGAITPRPSHYASDSVNRVWQDADFLEGALKRRVALAGGRLATHPFGYIGGNNKGPAELLHLRPRFNGSFDRNSHGTYPFPGVWALVGPLGATEKVNGSAVPKLNSHALAGTAAWYEMLDDSHFVTFRASQITLLPDWERIQRLVIDEPSSRRKWAWLMLPIHFGFPASASPGAGVVKRGDTGNTSVINPAFKESWNRTGASGESEAYEPTVLRVAGAPVTPWAAIQSGWGVFNVPLIAWGLMPGGNVAVTQLLPWLTGAMSVAGIPPLRTFIDRPAPLRITSFGQGVYQQFGGHNFALLLAQRPSESSSLANHLATTDSRVDGNSLSRDTGAGLRLWFNLHYGERIAIENTFAIDTSILSYQTRNRTNAAYTGRVSGRMILRELTGGVRYNVLTRFHRVAQLHARLGYGWTSYRVDDQALNGTSIGIGRREGGYLPTILPSQKWWPNTMYGGLGVEVLAPRRLWIFDRLGYGVRGELSALGHRVESKQCRTCGKVAERGDAALSAVFSW